MLKYLLDINICILTIEKRPWEVREAFKWHHGQMRISTVILMELIYDAEGSLSSERNLLGVEGFATHPKVIKYDKDVAVHTGQLRAELAHLDKQIGPYDQMITEHTRSQGLIIVTNNRREFGCMSSLRVGDWVAPVV